MIQPWAKKTEKLLADFRIFTVRSETKISPRTGHDYEFFVIDCVNWVNVIPMTPDGQVVMIEQYRHGSNTVELEIPGGMIDPSDISPLAAGLRELREETGYEGENGRVIGQIYPNPAIMSNVCYTVLVENCQIRHKIELDHGEDLTTRLVPYSEIPELIREGKIGHSLVAVAFLHYDLLLKAGANKQ